MALSGSVVWEVDRGYASASDNNGGGFDPSVTTPGTDYTYGAGQTRITWLAAGGTYTNDLAATNVANSVLTSASRNFVAADVGNVIHITAGTKFVAGWYTIISVATNAATLDRNCTDTTGNASAGSGYLGGTFLTVGGAGVAHVGSNKIWVKYSSGYYTATSTSANVANGKISLTAGAAATPTVLRGYETTRGDETANRPTFAWGVNALNSYLVTLNSPSAVENLVINGQAATYSQTGGIYSSGGVARHCRLTELLAATNNIGVLLLHDCEVDNCTGGTNTFSQGGGGALIYLVDCWIHDNTDTYVLGQQTTLYVSNCVFHNGGSNADIRTTGATAIFVDHCTFYASGVNAIAVTTAPAFMTIQNCHFQETGGAAISLSAAYGSVRLVNNSFYSNTGGNYDTSKIPADNIIGTVAITVGDPLVNAASHDFRPNATANRGALMRGTGFPQAYTGNATANKSDIGAYQHADPVIVTPAATSIYSGAEVTSDGVALVTGTLHASNISTAAGGGSNLSAGVLQSGVTVDDVTGTLTSSGGGPLVGEGNLVG